MPSIEYISQAMCIKTLDLPSISSFRPASAAAAVAHAKAEIGFSRSGVTVCSRYYAVSARSKAPVRAKNGRRRRPLFETYAGPRAPAGKWAFRRHQGRITDAGAPSPIAESPTRVPKQPPRSGRFDFSGFQRQLRGRPTIYHSAGCVCPPSWKCNQAGTRDNPDLRAALAAVREAGSGVTGARAATCLSWRSITCVRDRPPRYAANSVITVKKLSNLRFLLPSATLRHSHSGTGAPPQSRIKHRRTCDQSQCAGASFSSLNAKTPRTEIRSSLRRKRNRD